MTIREAVEILLKCDPDRTIYVLDVDGTAAPAVAIVDLQHINVDLPGIAIPDDVAFMTYRMLDETQTTEEDEANGC